MVDFRVLVLTDQHDAPSPAGDRQQYCVACEYFIPGRNLGLNKFDYYVKHAGAVSPKSHLCMMVHFIVASIR